MTDETLSRAADDCEAARCELEEALATAGIKLPSLQVDRPPEGGIRTFLIELGRCNLATACALADALRRAPLTDEMTTRDVL